MADDTVIRSALEGEYREGVFGADMEEGPGVTLLERRGVGLIQLDLGEEDEAGRGAAVAAARIALPREPCRSAMTDDRRALWTGPGRWLLQVPLGERRGLVSAVGAALSGRHHALIDLTHARAVISLSGPACEHLLSKGTAIDVHPRAFPVGACAMTSLAQVTALIHHRKSGVFDLIVFRSFAAHLWQWLHEAGEEYGVEVGPIEMG